MEDPTEGIRRVMVHAINSGAVQPEGREWTTDELTEEFEVIGFLAPYVVVRNKATGKKGSMMFRHNPRVYFGWKEEK